MKNTKEFKLINGLFNPADAGAVIKNFYSEKIRYHNRQLLHIIESQKGDRGAVETKIAELETTIKDISTFLALHRHSNSLVEVKGCIAITINCQSNG